MSPRRGDNDQPPETITEATDSPLFVYEGPGDRTIRPRRPNNPRFWPNGVPLPPPAEGNGEPPKS